MTRRVPFNKPCVVGSELDYIAQAVETGRIGGGGEFTRRCEAELQRLFKIRRVLMTNSCTAALEMAAMLCDLGPGDEVIMPSFTFVSTANAVVRAGARPHFVDIRQDTLNLDEQLVAAAVNENTKAIFPVHYAGVACDMPALMAIAARHDLTVVEDAAQAVNAFSDDRPLGTIGHLGAYSFHETKNYSCGEGGALCVNDERFVERAEIIRDKGTNRQAFNRGHVDKYTWMDVGSSYVPSDINCAHLLAQLEHLNEIGRRRARVYERYLELLLPLQTRGHLELPEVPAEVTTNHHLFHLLLPDEVARNALIDHLNGLDVQAVFHYVPLHSSPFGRKLDAHRSLPVTESIAARLVRLPLYCDLSEADQDTVVEGIADFFGVSGRSKR